MDAVGGTWPLQTQLFLGSESFSLIPAEILIGNESHFFEDTVTRLLGNRLN